MILRIGPMEIKVEVVGTPSNEILGLTVQELLSKEIKVISNQPTAGIQPRAAPFSQNQAQLDLLNSADFSLNTLVMVTNKVLGIEANGKQLPQIFSEVQRSAKEWFQRPIKEEFWAIFVGAVEAAKLGTRLVALGLNKKQQMTFLGMSTGSAGQLFKDLIDRGLPSTKVKFGLVSFAACTAKEFSANFPAAKVARDWKEFIADSDPADREELEQSMLSPDIDEARVAISRHKAPKELLNYYAFPRDLWRVLRTNANIKRIETELKSRMTTEGLASEQDKEMLVRWTILRLQFHWNKIPANSEMLKNLKYIKIQNEDHPIPVSRQKK